MKFNTKRKKFDYINNQENINTNEIVKQQQVNKRIDKEYNASKSSFSIFKKRRNLNTNWQPLLKVDATDDYSYTIYRYFNEVVEIQRVPESWIPHIKVNIEYRYINTPEERFFGDQLTNIYFSIEDIDNEDYLKNIKICAGVDFFKTFLPLTELVNKEIEARLNIKFQSPHNFI